MTCPSVTNKTLPSSICSADGAVQGCILMLHSTLRSLHPPIFMLVMKSTKPILNMDCYKSKEAVTSGGIE